MSQEITHKAKIYHTKRKFDIYIVGVIKNAYPQETVKEGMAEGLDSSRDSGDGLVVGVNGGMEASYEIASMSVSERTRISVRC